MDEIWHDIEGYEGLYQISNKGRVKSLKCGKERIRTPVISNSGYLNIILYKNTEAQHRLVHRLVAEAFIPNLENKPQINHKDENKLNNCVDNLEWVTAKENINHGTRNERAGYSRSKPILQYSKSGDFIREWQGAHEVERVLGIDNSHIIDCCRGKYKSSGGFVWRYKEERTE